MAVDVHRDIVRELAAGVLDGGWADSVEESEETAGNVASPHDHYPPQVRQAAFQLWAYESGHSIAGTQRLLRQRTGVEVTQVTLRQWSRDGEWAKTARDLHQILRSDSRQVVQNLLDIGMVKAARWAVGAFDDPSVSDTVKAKLVNSFLDRNGFPVLLRGEMTDSLSIPANSEYAGMSDAELEARIYEYAGDVEGQVLPEPTTDDRFEVMQNIERARSLSSVNRSQSR